MTLSIILICWLSFSANLDEVKNPCAENQEKKRFIEAPVAFFDLDRLGRICVVDTNNFISLYEQDGNKKYNFADNRLGKITSIDTSHPLKVMVFYADDGILLFLDNTLKEIERIKLQDSGKFLNVSAAALSNDNQIWIYDWQWQRLIKTNTSFEVLQETKVFNDLALADFKPELLTQKSNILLAAERNKGFVLFDDLGQLKTRILSGDMVNFQFEGNKILVQNKKGMAIQALDPPTQFNLPLPKGLSAEPYKQIRLGKDRWYIAYEDGINWLPK